MVHWQNNPKDGRMRQQTTDILGLIAVMSLTLSIYFISLRVLGTTTNVGCKQNQNEKK